MLGCRGMNGVQNSWPLRSPAAVALHPCAAGVRQRSAAAAASNNGGTRTPSTHRLIVTSESGMRRLAAAFARDLRAGDAYLLFGAVGAGKSAFSRAFIRAASGDPALTVPSPTFLLQQLYEEHDGAPARWAAGRWDLAFSQSSSAIEGLILPAPTPGSPTRPRPTTPNENNAPTGPPIHHFDLYRLDPASDIGRLDLPASFSQAVCLVEWPERLRAELAPQRWLEVSIEILSEVRGCD